MYGLCVIEQLRKEQFREQKKVEIFRFESVFFLYIQNHPNKDWIQTAFTTLSSFCFVDEQKKGSTFVFSTSSKFCE